MRVRILSVLLVSLIITACAVPANSPARQTVSTPASAVAVPTVVPPTLRPTATSPASTIATSPTAQLTATPIQRENAFTLVLEPIVTSGLTRPTDLAVANDATGRLFVVEQPGRIRTISNGRLFDQPFLDITDRVLSEGNEQGLLSVALHPDFRTNGQLFVDYTRQPDGATVIERYTVSGDPNYADKNSATQILVIPQPQANHNGGQLQFGPDGYLYIGMGDGGGQGDQHGSIGNGQNRNVLLGKLLRIDVTHQDTYAIPPTNPFNTEVWAFGLRNPWRFSFDRATGDLYIADVGQDTYEEVDFQPAASKGGENYGWRSMEGRHCYDPQEGCDQTGLVLPVAEYSHAVGGCAITGGYIYRGAQYPVLQGQYFFGDYCTGIMWSLQRAGDQWQMTKRLESGLHISSFGEDVYGEIYVIDLGGGVYRLSAK